MILLAFLSLKFAIYAIGTVAFTIFIGIKFLKFNSDLKRIEKKSDFLKENPLEARNFASQLSSLYLEKNAETEEVFNKLSSLKYQKDFGSHTVYLCMELSRTSFLVITLYEYLDTSKENSTEILFELNYRIVLNYVDNTLQIYSDESPKESISKLKKDFIKRFLSNHCAMEVQ